MSKYFTAAFLVISTLLVAQTRYRTVSGRLTDSNNEPLPGVNITVKGATTGTVTDADGNYSLEAPIGGTVVFAFIGMKTREMRVTENDLITVPGTDTRPDNAAKSKTRKPSERIPAFTLHSDSSTAGVAILNNNTPTYVHSGPQVEADKIWSIKPTLTSGLKRSKTFRVRMAPYIGYSLQFMTAVGIENITRTPSLQGIYVQGLPQGGESQWRGPEYREIFSWGPALSSLQYDGNSYPYDQNGRLVPRGTGNGKDVRAYDALQFFRMGFNTAYSLNGVLQRSGWGRIVLDASHKKHQGVIPNSESTQDHIAVQVKKIPLRQYWTSDVNVGYDRSAGTLVNRGGNFTSIVGAVWSTPVSFDNADGLSPRRADESTQASRFPNGDVRTHAPGRADNPYGMARELPDQDLTGRLLGGLIVRRETVRGFNITTQASLEKQWNEVVSGLPPGFSGAVDGRLTHRDEEQTAFNFTVAPRYIKYIQDHTLEFNITYDHHYQLQELDRFDRWDISLENWGETDAGREIAVLRRSVMRSIQELSVSGEYALPKRIAIVKLSNHSYFSNTLPTARYTNFFPSVQAKVAFDDLLELYQVEELSLSGSYARTLHEAPLIYSNWSYLSTTSSPSQYNTFYEARELFFNDQLLPEIEHKMQAVVNFNVGGRLYTRFTLHNNVITDFIAPRQRGYIVEFANVGRTRNYGTTAAAKWRDSFSRGRYEIGIQWARQNSVVTDLYTADQYIPTAGFTTIAKVLAEDKPLGAIYGTRYQRNASGQIMVGNDGFPLVDPTMTMIGNPIPDWTGSITGGFEWNRFRIDIVFDIRKGGDAWNGTQAALDYLGRSSTTGDERNTYRYIFPGIDPQGQPNVTPVSFHDPATPLDQNRWVRYGFEGVGEAYIEDASWIRLQELAASYTIRPESPSKVSEVKFSLIANNLFLITGYSGVDPSSSLFGYAGSTGLDLFNMPAVRSFTAKMTIKL